MAKTNDKIDSAPDMTALPAETIAALATPPGRSGVAVIRLSGGTVDDILAALGMTSLPAPRVASLRTLYHPHTHEVIDQGLVLYFPAPHSFTGETVAELHVHGSRSVIRSLLDALTQLPACRLAEPGEFTRRAFINGKMDLVAAEGLADLIAADTNAQRAQALRQLHGEVSGHYEAMRAQLVQSLALVEAYIDFPDEEIPESVLQDLQATVSTLKQNIAEILDDQHIGEKVRDGWHLAILGAPNAGKSSLLNALARRDAAIVSPVAGTTRDTIEVELDLQGYSLTVIDTAGLRDSDDPIEQEGVRRARARADQADFTLVCFDATQLPLLDETSRQLIMEDTLVVITKSDQMQTQIPATLAAYHPISLSVVTGDGLPALLAQLQERVTQQAAGRENTLITRARHRRALQVAHEHLAGFHPDQAIECQAEELRQAALQFAKITGRIAVDELLDAIFSQFCIGK